MRLPRSTGYLMICRSLSVVAGRWPPGLRSRSFRTPVTELHGLIELVSELASLVAEKARQQHAAAGVQAFITTSTRLWLNFRSAPTLTRSEACALLP